MTISTKLLGYDFVFETKPGLFSKERIDEGTKLLLEKIQINSKDTVLDLGCGYGVIGLVAARSAKEGKVYMVDTDIRAVKYARINSELNRLKNTEVLSSDGFEELKDLQFDLVLSNPPTHMPKETILEFLEGSKKQLNSGGKLYFVTEKRIKPFIKRELERVFGNYTEIANGPKHTVFLATKD